MRRPLFEYVEQIRLQKKYFDVDRGSIQRALLVNGKCEVTTDHEIIDDTGQVIATELRLNVAARSEVRQSWQIALKLHNVRIDGIDHESKFTMVTGEVGRGWHRHQWNPSEDSAERWKVPITDLDGVQTREEFLIRVLKLMRIELNAASDNGQYSLLVG